ncbi:sugar-binding domain-containing protein [Streptomyces sp. NPDC091271]|uniref:sugar-binding domain-containing protein n=1 Tax=Streptomyces sp. NPDC091271 TaxID=3365980 RepID=UPI0037F9D5FE
MTSEDQKTLKELGAVGDVCARYFDIAGNPVDRSRMNAGGIARWPVGGPAAALRG